MSYPDVSEGDQVVVMDGSLYKMAYIAKVTAAPTDKMVMLATYSKGKGFGNPARRTRGIILGKLDFHKGMSLDCICEMIEVAKQRETEAIRTARSLFNSQINGLVA